MNKYDDIERILKKLVEENPDEMENIDDIDESVLLKIEQKALSKIEKSNKERKPRIYMRTAAAVFAVIAVFSITLYLIDIPSTRADTDAEGVKSSAEVSEPSSAGATSMNLPGNIPEGYVLDSILFNDKETAYFAEYKYLNPADENLYILVRIEGEPIVVPNEYETDIQELENKNGVLLLTTVYSEPVVNYANFMDGRGLGVQIAATVDEKTIMRIIGSME